MRVDREFAADALLALSRGTDELEPDLPWLGARYLAESLFFLRIVAESMTKPVPVAPESPDGG